jgi:UDP-sulfoquinovose synthase
MRVLIVGVDGYLGWALAQHLVARQHEVSGCDNFSRRDWVAEVGSQSATPIVTMPERLQAFRERYGTSLSFLSGNILEYPFVWNMLKTIRPDAIVHLGEMPSAAYSMIDVNHCVFTQTNNVMGTLNLLHAMRDVCPEAHLVKLGTMGEYGTPNLDIPEGFFDIEYRGRRDRLPFPRQAGSWYHQTKVHDSNNIMMACRIWRLRSTDIMQGVVFGTRIAAMGDDERLLTRFDFDQCFGTVINRYCAQAAIGMPLTPFGKGNQRRGFLPLCDSMQCLTLAIENPPATSEYRVLNQFAEVYSINELAQKVLNVGRSMGLDVELRPLENPRAEAEEHWYNPDHLGLMELGYVPSLDLERYIRDIIADLLRYRSRIEARAQALTPDIRWDGSRHEAREYKPPQA